MMGQNPPSSRPTSARVGSLVPEGRGPIWFLQIMPINVLMYAHAKTLMQLVSCALEGRVSICLQMACLELNVYQRQLMPCVSESVGFGH